MNGAADAMGFTEALRHGFHIHQLGHAHWAAHNENRAPLGLPRMSKTGAPPGPPLWPAATNPELSALRRSAGTPA